MSTKVSNDVNINIPLMSSLFTRNNAKILRPNSARERATAKPSSPSNDKAGQTQTRNKEEIVASAIGSINVITGKQTLLKYKDELDVFRTLSPPKSPRGKAEEQPPGWKSAKSGGKRNKDCISRDDSPRRDQVAKTAPAGGSFANSNDCSGVYLNVAAELSPRNPPFTAKRPVLKSPSKMSAHANRMPGVTTGAAGHPSNQMTHTEGKLFAPRYQLLHQESRPQSKQSNNFCYQLHGPIDYDALLNYAPADEQQRINDNYETVVNGENFAVHVPTSTRRLTTNFYGLRNQQDLNNPKTEPAYNANRYGGGLWTNSEADIKVKHYPSAPQKDEINANRTKLEECVPAVTGVVDAGVCNDNCSTAAPAKDDAGAGIPYTHVIRLPKSVNIGQLDPVANLPAAASRPVSAVERARPGSRPLAEHKYVVAKPSTPATSRSRPASSNSRPSSHEEKLNVEYKTTSSASYRPIKLAFSGAAGGFRNQPHCSRTYGNSSSAIRMVLDPTAKPTYQNVSNQYDDDDRSCASAPAVFSRGSSVLEDGRGAHRTEQPVQLRKDVISNRIAVGYHGRSEMEHKMLADRIAHIRKPVVFDIPMVKTEHVKLADRPDNHHDIVDNKNDIGAVSIVSVQSIQSAIDVHVDLLQQLSECHDDEDALAVEINSKGNAALSIGGGLSIDRDSDMRGSGSNHNSQELGRSQVEHNQNNPGSQILSRSSLLMRNQNSIEIAANQSVTLMASSSSNGVAADTLLQASSASYGYYGITPNMNRERKREEKLLRKLAALNTEVVDNKSHGSEDAIPKWTPSKPTTAPRGPGIAIPVRTFDLVVQR